MPRNVYFYVPSVSSGATVTAVFKWARFALILIAGAIALAHWWNVGQGGGKIVATQSAPKATNIIFAREDWDASNCPPENDCSVTAAVQTFTGTLYSHTDPTFDIGYSVARCVAVGPLGDGDLGYWQRCETLYVFSGDGNVTAGTITASGLVLTPDDAPDYRQVVYGITGGTGAYAGASGGAVSYVPVEASLPRDLAFTDVVVTTASA